VVGGAARTPPSFSPACSPFFSPPPTLHTQFTSLQSTGVVTFAVVLIVFALFALVGCALFESLDLKRAKRIPSE
jgi:hypothetical protein